MNGFLRSKTNGPCPVCGRVSDEDCRFKADRNFVLCHKNFSPDVPGWIYLRPDKLNRCGVYVREGSDSRSHYRRAMAGGDSLPPVPIPGIEPSPAPRTASAPPRDPDAALRVWREHIARTAKPLHPDSPQAKSWAAHLGLPDPAAFEKIETLWLEADDYNRGELLAFPERDGQGKIIGYSTRYLSDSRKLAVGQRGIIIPRALTPTSRMHEGPIYLVEGASDTLALLTMGFNVIGRPSNTGGADYLAEFLRRLPRDWYDGEAENYLPRIVIVGENDRKDNGDWPGSYGAFRLAHRLTTDLGCAVRVVFPESAYKDVRDWFRAEMKRCSNKPYFFTLEQYVGGRWDYHVYANAVTVRPSDPPPPQPQPPSQPQHQSPLDLSDLDGEKIAEAVRAGKKARGEDSVAEEAAAAECIRAMQRDFNRFPCERCRKIVLEHKRTSETWLIEARCAKRSCSGCRAYLDSRELANASLRFKTAERDGLTLYRFDVGPELWRSLRAAIRKARGQYLRMISPGGYRVWTTAVLAGCWKSSATRAVAAADAVADLSSLLSLYGFDKRPVTTSHAWALPKEDEPSRQFRRIGKGDPSLTPTTILEIADAVQAIPVLVAPKKPNGSILRMWRFMRPGGWHEGMKDKLHESLFAGEVVEPGVSACGVVGGGGGGDGFDGDHGDENIDWMAAFDGL